MRRTRRIDPRPGAALARVAPRRVRRALDHRAVPGWDDPLGPVRVDGAVVTLRVPRLTDGPDWRAARLALRDQLEPWWPTRRSWAEDHDGLTWTGWCTAARAAGRRGLAHPFVLLVDGELRGQVGVDAVDLGTRTGELSFWVDTAAVPRGTAAVALALVSLRALQSPVQVRRLVAPVAVTNPRPGRTLARLGFTAETTLREYRATAAGRSDHVVHTLHAGPGTLEHLRSVVHEVSRTAAVGLDAPRPSVAARGRAAALRGRLAVRSARATARAVRPPPGWDRPVGEAVVDGRRLVVRLPELADGPAWRDARLRSRRTLEPWWPVDGDWEGHQSLAHWAEEVTLLRGAARRGRALPGVVEVDGRVVGQVGVDAVDLGTGSGEVSVWLDPTSRGGTVLPAAGLLLALAAFSDRLGLDRLVAPVAVGNRAAAAAAQSFGFHDEGVLTAYRATAAGWTDHHVFVLANHPGTTELLRARLAALTDRP